MPQAITLPSPIEKLGSFDLKVLPNPPHPTSLGTGTLKALFLNIVSICDKILKTEGINYAMSNQSGTDRGGLLNSVETALRGSSILFYWIIVTLPVLFTVLFIGIFLGGIAFVLGFLAYVVFEVFAIVYGAHLLRRGIEGIGKYFNNQTLIREATVQFILWLLMLILPAIASFYNTFFASRVVPLIVLIPLGLKMRDVSKALYDTTGIKTFDTARNRWKWAAYLAIIGIAIIALFVLYSTRKGFKEMINQMVQ
jgi:uncharacterized membrane protein